MRLKRYHCVMALVVGLSLVGSDAFAERQTVLVEKTILRRVPRGDGIMVTSVTRGTALDVLKCEGDWCQVQTVDGAAMGWLHRATISGQEGVVMAEPDMDARPASSSRRREPSEDDSEGSGRMRRQAGRALGAGVELGGWRFGFGGHLRSWFVGNFGLQMGVSHYGVGGVGGYSLWQVSPGVIFGFQVGDRSSYGPVSWRPYAGGGLTIYRSNYDSRFLDSTTDYGFHGLGGVEVSFGAIPQLTATAQVAYHQSIDSYPGISSYGGLSFSTLGHWYFK